MRVPRASTTPDSDLSSFRSRGCCEAPIDRLIEIDTNNSPHLRKLKESRQKVWLFRAQNLRNSPRVRIEREVPRFYFFRDHTAFVRNFPLAACRYFHITLDSRSVDCAKPKNSTSRISARGDRYRQGRLNAESGFRSLGRLVHSRLSITVHQAGNSLKYLAS